MRSQPSESSNSRRAVLLSGASLTATALTGCTARLPILGDTPRAKDKTTCSTSISTPVEAEASTWPMGGHDAGATRHNPVADANTVLDESVWVKSLPQSHLPTDPVIGPDRLYVGIGNHEPTPPKTRVAAFALADGALEWKYSLTYAVDATPTLAADGEGTTTLFALSGQDNSSTGPGKGEVVALNPSTGEKRWR